MDPISNLQHWESWAQEFGQSLRATTKCISIKQLEIATLALRISKEIDTLKCPILRVFEVGCGNALNGIALCKQFPQIVWLGCDYSQQMIQQAKINIEKIEPEIAKRMSVITGNALELDIREWGNDKFDVIYTDRCLINLSSADEQIRACKQIFELLTDKGLYLMLENSSQSHARLNELRHCLGLPYRPPADYNLFVDEHVVIPELARISTLEGIDEFGSLHDILLYVLKPALHPKHEVVYDDEIMAATTKLCLHVLQDPNNHFGNFGQNRLWRFRKKKGLVPESENRNKSVSSRSKISFEHILDDASAIRTIMDWRNDPESRKQSFHSEPKIWPEFMQEFREKHLADPTLPCLFALEGSTRVGFLHFRRIADPKERTYKCCDISINISSENRGCGLGTQVIKAVLPLLQSCGIDSVLACIKVGNDTSVRAFQSAGFNLLDEINHLVADTGQTIRVQRFLIDLKENNA